MPALGVGARQEMRAQIQEGRVVVVCWAFGEFPDRVPHSRHPCEQAAKAGLAEDIHDCTFLRRESQEARELNRVPEALLGVNEQPLALQRLAFPARNSKGMVGVVGVVGSAGSPFVFRPTPAVVALHQVSKSQVEMSAYMTGRDLDCALEARDGPA